MSITEALEVRDLEAVDQVIHLEDVDQIIHRYEGEKGSLMPVLQDVNAEYSYLPEEVLRHVAHELDLPLSQVLHVATFYNVFSLEPRGKHLIRVCDGTSCHVRGGFRILAGLEKQLGVHPGETTADMKFTLETVRCVGCCALSPCIVIDTTTHARLRPDAVAALLRTYE
jgi:NADH-quinone oxidoreductase subunit E